MPYTPNDFHSDLRQSEVFAAFLDKYFYRPMEKLIEEPCPEATPVWFERVWGIPTRASCGRPSSWNCPT